MAQLNIAVIGSGISGLSAAWLLSSRHRVALYETESVCGGHANTVDVRTPDGVTAVDTGFIVYNEKNYPNLTALFHHLGVPTEPTEMSFALSLDNGGYEYSGSGFAGFFGQPSNLCRPRHWRLAADIARFFQTAQTRIVQAPANATLGDFLQSERYSKIFIEDHIVPMGAAIWSTDMETMLDFPARSFVEFYANHGMLQFRDRPAWRSVAGGSRTYVERILSDGGFEVQPRNRIRTISRNDRYVSIVDSHGVSRAFDHAVIATHADQALGLLDQPREMEARVLGAFAYQPNRAVLHRDTHWMPRRRRLWSSWNYIKQSDGPDRALCVTYWMNRLQNLTTSADLFVTLNPPGEIHPKAVDRIIDYRHPVFTSRALEAQRQLCQIQGQRRTWFCGSYFGFGFHEDGAQSGLAVAEELGGVRRPWAVENASSRIAAKLAGISEAAE